MIEENILTKIKQDSRIHEYRFKLWQVILFFALNTLINNDQHKYQ